jgi:NAD(P)-dependent dehydrogenase (short-subunit alcohol dehydrogenase family)
LDVVVGSAGKYFSGTIENTSENDFDDIMNVNFKGTFFLLKSVLPILKKQQQGSIILVGSDQCFVGKQGAAVYGASKGALGQLTKSAALDYASFNVRVNAVCPGTIDTPLYRKAISAYHEKTGIPLKNIEEDLANAQPLQRIGLSKEVAEFIFFLGSDAASFITGGLFPIDGGYTAQ